MSGEEGHKAMLWETAPEGKAQCFLCAHRCLIADGNRGLCHVRLNRGGELYTLVYGPLVAMNIDPIEKKPLFHFQPGTVSLSVATAGCNFRCGFCQNWQISQAARQGNIDGRFVAPEELVKTAKAKECASISYTYTEPTIFFEYAYDTARLAHDSGLKNVFVTNGYQTPETIEKMAGMIDAANVDLKSFSNDFYRKQCKARLEPVLEAIRLMHAAGIFIEVTTLVVPGQNDDEEQLRGIAGFIAGICEDIPWHISRFHPDYEMNNTIATPMEAIQRAIDIGREEGLRFVYAGNVVGWQDTVCPQCGAVVIARNGFAVSKANLTGNNCGGCGKELPFIAA
ncbi:MAG: AmmeMemoRadiSam system radical SAM enzyme [Phycisphaerae bacterium]|nr:AmmeMemoRadiSam system radical SAM enzyme [Phycisphaerae bacterium]